MENWPIDSRVRDIIQPVTQRHGPRKILPEPHWDTLIIDGGTWSVSRILTEGRNGMSKLSWTNVHSTTTRISASNTRCIFPPTRYNITANDGISFERKVLYTNAWLRKHRAIEDLEAIFLRQVLEENENYHKEALEHDPYCSELLAISFITKGHKKRAGVLAYPMGQYFDSLGVSVMFDEKWGTVVTPVEKPGWKAPGPILQITCSNTIYKPSTLDYTNAGCLFSVRTLFDVNFVSIAPKPGAIVPAKPTFIAAFGKADIGNRRPFDVTFNPHNHTHGGLVVSDIGTVWSFEQGSAPYHLYSATDDMTTRVGACDLPYWGMSWGAHPETFLLGSRSSLSLYDRRISDVASMMPIKSENLTSFDVTRNKDFSQIFLSGTDHVSLVDERMFDRPVVSWAHGREHDRTLQIKALKIEDKQVGLLSSKRSSFISVYNPLLSESGGLVGCDSYGLEWGRSNRCISASIAVYIPPNRAKSENPEVQGTLFHLSHAGAIYRQDLAIGTCKPSGEEAIWAHELKSLAAMVHLEHEEYDESDLTKSRDIPVRKEYISTFMPKPDVNPEGINPSVTEVVDLAPTVFQRADEPIDRVMILHDMVRMVSQEMSAATPRSLFASAHSVPLPRAKLLLKHVAQLRSHSREAVSWIWDVSPTQTLIWPFLAPTPSLEDLVAFSVGNNASSMASKRDEEARQEIALDLALAMTAYSVVPFQPSRPRLPLAPVVCDNDEMLSVAASALTLEDTEPPHVQHVQPCPTKGLIDGKRGAEQRQSLATRLLAMEWDPDSSPNDYEFFDPYSQNYDESMPAWRLMAQTKVDKQLLEQAKSRFLGVPTAKGPWTGTRSIQLPAIQISRPKAPNIPKPVAARAKVASSRLGESQPEPTTNQTMSSRPREPPSSHTEGGSQLPSTQIVPGPFGGRPGIGGPKKKKSRLPGF